MKEAEHAFVLAGQGLVQAGNRAVCEHGGASSRWSGRARASEQEELKL